MLSTSGEPEDDTDVDKADYEGFAIFTILVTFYFNNRFYADVPYMWMTTFLIMYGVLYYCAIKCRNPNSLSGRFGLLYTIEPEKVMEYVKSEKLRRH